jgi:hypothetical protein
LGKMSDWIDEWREEGIHPLMGKCPFCGKRFVVDEGMLCDCEKDPPEEERCEDHGIVEPCPVCTKILEDYREAGRCPFGKNMGD